MKVKVRRSLMILFVLAACGWCLPGLSKASREPESEALVAAQTKATQKGAPPLPIVPLILNYQYETKYFVQWIAGCPQYSMIMASVGNGDHPRIQIVLVEKQSERRIYYSNSEPEVKNLVQAGLAAHTVKIDFKTGEDSEERPAFAFGFPDEHGVPIRWRFVAAGQSSDRGAGPRIQAVKGGLLVSYNEMGTVAGPSALVQVGDKSYEVEQWDAVSKPPYFVGFHGTISEGMTLGILLNGSENWRVQSAPADLKEGARWVLVDDRKFVRQMQITARKGNELTIVEMPDKTPLATSMELLVISTEQGFALRAMTQKSGPNSMRITFTPELNLFSAPSGTALTESRFQIDQNAHQKVLQGSATVEAQGGTLILKLQPKLDGYQSRQTVLPKGYTITSSITTDATGYKIEVH